MTETSSLYQTQPTGFINVARAAELLSKTEEQIRSMCVKGELPGALKKEQRWVIPVGVIPEPE